MGSKSRSLVNINALLYLLHLPDMDRTGPGRKTDGIEEA